MYFEKLFEKYDTIIFFDTETTGFDALTDQIIELAAVAITRDGEKRDMDRYVQLHMKESVPEDVVKLTGIMDITLATSGMPEEKVIREFMGLFGEKTLLTAYNAQFDLDFVAHAVIRSCKDQLRLFNTADYLDPLTVCKDRKPYPHKLSDAIDFYHVEGQNSHRAIDDCEGLLNVTIAQEEERDDVYKYVNVFGFNPKYGAPERKFKKVCYHPQPFGEPKLPYDILPYAAGVIKYNHPEKG